ncbi:MULTISPECIES: ATP-dependent Clp protease ATP-binding subunit [Bacillus cereus group]|uniref:ATP-dependent Clp protease ATP-binding subunit n=1 Tax=Bacillus cereus group TaxID=86661 RepID=UPI0022E4331F|nr:ATP-dependent Clp protease ATP-binding subunit [Bacillus cereus group sp. TH152-1LC]MDA1674787.1 ATP-dependent Clp protease ATP-binding subunit [Bacillus cereus group sp. TH152-1LC]
MEQFICQVCEERYTLQKITNMNGQPLHICAHCLRVKLESGELKLKGKEKVEFLEKISLSIKQESPNSLKTTASSTENKPIFALQFGFDLTEKARKKQLDPLIGRSIEIENTLRILKRRTKNNPILVGEPGVGKTAIVEGIAEKIASGEVPSNLRDKKIISIPVGNLIAGTKFRGEFEDRLKKIIEEARERKDIILFLDEFHTIMGSGSDGSMDGAQMLKPALSRGEIQIIGATTFDEYRIHIEKDRALERRLQKVVVSQPTVENSIEILRGLKNNYEKFHDVTIPDEMIYEAVALTEKYVNDRMLPDKAIDLIDEACAHRSLLNTDIEETVKATQSNIINVDKEKETVLSSDNFEEAKKLINKEQSLHKTLKRKETSKRKANVISKDDLAHVLNQWTGIPTKELSKKEVEKLRSLEIELKQHVKGQDKSIETLAKAIKRNHLGLKDDNRPIGVFMMLGPSGVGKTELTKALTTLLLGDENKLIRLDMSEYKEKHTVSQLIGSPPGYVGYEDEGKLTKGIRQNPYSVVLFDEVEKAHPEVTDLFLQLFDEGRITDAKGRTIDAKNCIFIMTSNVGSDLYGSKKTALGYDTEETTPEQELEKKVKARLKDHYRPEFINRIDDVMVFNRLTKENMIDIAKKFSDGLIQKLATKGIELKLSKSTIELLAEKGYDVEMGARPMKREIDKLKTLIADKLIESDNITKLSVSVKNKEFFVK